ncbi:MAG TPA: hypothetical protein VF147_06560 [Vicinamibacterales bacterium]
MIRDRRRAPLPAKAPPPVSFAEHYRLQWPWATESEWIVTDVSAALLNIAGQDPTNARVTARPVPQGRAVLAHFDLALPSATVPIDITDYIWSPSAYVSFARTLAGPATAPCEAPGEAELIEALLTPTADVLLRENARISAALKREMRCAASHEQAALLLGALALREASGQFNDPRKVMSRMTAHLAFAAALEGAPSPRQARQLAEAVLLTLAVRQQNALDAIAPFERPDATPVLFAWGRALRARNTGDWRHIPTSPRPSLLEMLSAVRAARHSVGEGYTHELIERFGRMPEVPDVGRLMLTYDLAVTAGSRYASSNILLETTEAARARAAFTPAAAVEMPDQLIRELNVEPAPGPVASDGAVWVIDWGTWAAASQRHLLMTLKAYDIFVETALAIRDGAKEFREATERSFSGLRLYAIAAWLLASNKEENDRAMIAGIELARVRPDLISAWMWKSLLSPVGYGPVPPSMPPDRTWFAPLAPPGTAFDHENRPYTVGNVLRMSVPELQQMRAIAPYSRSLRHAIVRQVYPRRGYTAAQVRAEAGPRADYDLYFMGLIADASIDDPGEYDRAMRAAAQFEPSYLVSLGDYYLDLRRLDEAQRAYEQWLAHEPHEIAISNRCPGILALYFETKALGKARALAERATDGYTGPGLAAAADFYDKIGNADKAEELLRGIYERYESAADYLGFLIRHDRGGDTRYGLLWQVFPGGIQRVTLPQLSGTPQGGVILESIGETGKRAGLAVGDAVVAVDGIRIHNLEQYRAAKKSSADPLMHFIIWRNREYMSIDAPVRGYWPRSNLREFTGPNPQAAPVR